MRRTARPAGPHLPTQERQAALTGAEDSAASLDLLRRAQLEIAGRLVAASNTTLYCKLLEPGDAMHSEPGAAGTDPRDSAGEHDGDDAGDEHVEGDDDLTGDGCVYKPVRGERPLWDFPDGTLAAREVAAYEVSQRTGWNLVPPTILRDGPFGVGMCQLWMEHDDTDLVDIVPRGRVRRGWLHVVDAQGGAGDDVMLVHADDPELRRTAVFDVVINNADRKAGHLLPTADGLRVVDHGVTFHVEPKLRTVLWGWAGTPLRDDEITMLEALRADLAADLGVTLRRLLAPAEVKQTLRRVDRLLRTGVLPAPVHGWRGLPWPPF